MKKLGIFILAALVIMGSLVLAKNIIAKTAMVSTVKALTGLRVIVEDMDIGLLKTSIGVKSLKLYNPSGFKDRVMMDLGQIYVDYDLGSFLGKQIHLEEVRLNVKEMIVVKNEAGELNLNSLKTFQGHQKKDTSYQESQKGQTPQMHIDVLELKVGNVIYKDYSGGEPVKIREFKVNIDERFTDISDTTQLVNLILAKVLFKTALGNITDFDSGEE